MVRDKNTYISVCFKGALRLDMTIVKLVVKFSTAGKVQARQMTLTQACNVLGTAEKPLWRHASLVDVMDWI